MNEQIFKEDIVIVFDYLNKIIFKQVSNQGQSFRDLDGYAGFTTNFDKKIYSIGFGILLGGIGFSIKRSFQDLEDENLNYQRFDYFDSTGKFTYSSTFTELKLLTVDNHLFELSCPIINHLYNFLSYEYKKTKENNSDTVSIFNIENYLKMISKKFPVQLSYVQKDEDIINLYLSNIIKNELDPVLNWNERQLKFKKSFDEINHLIKVKTRAHNGFTFRYYPGLIFKRIHCFFKRILLRPMSNIQGLLYALTISKVIWFFQTVKENLGYSVALAVYGPFTYYFITMPMNPHAMTAVGKVRNVYLEMTTGFEQLIEKSESKLSQFKSFSKTANAQPNNPLSTVNPVTHQDHVSHIQATSLSEPTMAQELASNIVATKLINNQSFTFPGISAPIQSSLMGLPLNTDVPEIQKMSWSERMGNFKNMQIAYEENLEFSPRMGRLEQLETQYNFPLMVESTWEEIERYNERIFLYRSTNPNLSAKFKQYLFNEVNRSQQLQLYLWDRLARYIIDQPYVMLDQNNEQKRNDYYVGRAFVFMKEMTQVLTWRYENFKKPEGYDKIEKLANLYQDSRKEFQTISQNLEANSNLFQLKDVFNSTEFRKLIKRQWEILYLQNAKAEEGANNGLNMYNWSIRNTIWALQTIYSAKREELEIQIRKEMGLSLPLDSTKIAKINMIYETVFHNMVLEFVSIKEEMGKNIPKDIESQQRMVLINNLKEFFNEKDQLKTQDLAQAPILPSTKESSKNE